MKRKQQLNVSQVVSKSKRQRTTVRKLQLKAKSNRELGHHELKTALAGLPGTGGITNLTNIPQGSKAYERIGLQIDLVSLQIRYLLYQSSTATVCRIIIFQWNRPSTPLITDLLEASTSAEDIVYSPISINNGNYIRVLRDDMFHVGTSNRWQTQKHFINLAPRKAHWLNDAGAVAEGHIYIYMASNHGLGTATQGAFYSRSRFYG